MFDVHGIIDAGNVSADSVAKFKSLELTSKLIFVC